MRIREPCSAITGRGYRNMVQGLRLDDDLKLIILKLTSFNLSKAQTRSVILGLIPSARLNNRDNVTIRENAD